MQGSGKPMTAKAKTVHAQTGVERDLAYYSQSLKFTRFCNVE